MGLSVPELCKIVCEENKQVSEYLGIKWNMEHNRKIKPVIDMILNNHGKNIKLVNINPIVLQYIEDDNSESDISDISDITKENHEKNINRKDACVDFFMV